MIKIRLRRNLLYLLALYSSYFIRKIVSIIIDNVYQLNAPFIYLYMMTLGETMGGLAVYFYQNYNWNKKKEVKYFGLKLIYNKIKATNTDWIGKKILLILFAGFFDFTEFIIVVFFVPKLARTSPSIKTRLGCLATITSSLICVYALRFPIGRHQICSLIFMGLSFLATLILEIILKSDEQDLGRFISAHAIIMVYLMLISFNDCTERYLANYNFLNPFFILAGEGIFEFVISIFYSINKDPFKGIIDEYNENSTGKFALLIIILFIYLILSAVVNAYKVYCNVIYTPMARSLTEYFLNPLTNIYYYINENDFHNNYIYFIISEIVCIIMDFSFYVFNEYVILSCCDLDYDTRDEIHDRGSRPEQYSLENYEDEEENIHDDKQDKNEAT